MAREVTPDATVCCDLNIHGAVMGYDQKPRFWIPEAYFFHKEFKPHPVTPIPGRMASAKAEAISVFGAQIHSERF